MQSVEDEFQDYKHTYFRVNRRDDGKSGLIFKGTQKENDNTLNIIIDTSGSMYCVDLFSKLFGIIESLCLSKNIETARIQQCDTGVTSDDLRYPIMFGGGVVEKFDSDFPYGRKIDLAKYLNRG